MELILKEDVIGLGFKNDIVNVKSGYGRNYLIPQGKAVIASPSAKKILAENLKQQAHKLAALKAAAEEKAAALEGVALTITAKVSATGQLYGSVTNMTVADELAKLGKEVDRKIIVLKDIKKVGEYVAVVRFHKEVSAEIPVTVVAEGGVAPVAEAPAEAPVAAPVEEDIDETEAPVEE
ncbi:50S ribosomal protein L9 [uncultured Prevotella sp.]|jgi:large subunit ribosomal protein L9|uniref:50S ribosomal protein L9 n=1 Tax=uncultured Prevotella sp. TaxID=159272 RepID=UPI0025CCC0AF|nr:50S ribosomal protein L9 [uncultured Prevotella sp.]